jgi:hypothetical protein
LEIFVILKQRKPSNYIAEMWHKTCKYGATQEAFPSQITKLNQFIAADFGGQTLTDRLSDLAERQGEPLNGVAPN